MVSIVAFEFSSMRYQPLRRALVSLSKIIKNSRTRF
ncbi:acetyltransferase [Vibrio cholerae]|nr:acetyltransferase [Vibrio cholerae]EGR2014560.1 acetyltransferase [Vibrio cholerae]